MFKRAPNTREASSKRVFETQDIAKRLGVLAPERTYINNHPIGRPIAIFNPAALLSENGDFLEVYARIIVGYYMYVSAIMKIDILLDDVLSGRVSTNYYSGYIVIAPSTKYDIWGVEDPRTTRISDKRITVYCGRTVNYFNPAIRKERTLPVMAYSRNGSKWIKRAVFVFPSHIRGHIISDKDAFVYVLPSGKTVLFHRPHTDDDNHYLVISEIPSEALSDGNKVEEFSVSNTHIVLDPAPFEIKLGWATPPIPVSNQEYLVFIHGIDKEIEAYRAFAALLKEGKDSPLYVTAVTPTYVIEPREPYEIFGDRPYVVFPCAALKIDNQIVMLYGAADYVVGFASIDLTHLLELLDKGRVE